MTSSIISQTLQFIDSQKIRITDVGIGGNANFPQNVISYKSYEKIMLRHKYEDVSYISFYSFVEKPGNYTFCSNISIDGKSSGISLVSEIEMGSFFTVFDSIFEIQYGYCFNDANIDRGNMETIGAAGYYHSFFYKLFHPKRKHQDFYWMKNQGSYQKGIIRDIYPINLFNDLQLSQKVGNLSFKDYLVQNKIGELDKFTKHLLVLKTSEGDKPKIKNLKKIVGKDSFIVNW